MAITAQKVALMVLMLGLMMMGVTVLALADDYAPFPTGQIKQDPFPTGKEKRVGAIVPSPEKSALQQSPVQQEKLYSNYVHPVNTPANYMAADDIYTLLPEPFTQQLD